MVDSGTRGSLLRRYFARRTITNRMMELRRGRRIALLLVLTRSLLVDHDGKGSVDCLVEDRSLAAGRDQAMMCRRLPKRATGVRSLGRTGKAGMIEVPPPALP